MVKQEKLEGIVRELWAKMFRGAEIESIIARPDVDEDGFEYVHIRIFYVDEADKAYTSRKAARFLSLLVDKMLEAGEDTFPIPYYTNIATTSKADLREIRAHPVAA